MTIEFTDIVFTLLCSAMFVALLFCMRLVNSLKKNSEEKDRSLYQAQQALAELDKKYAVELQKQEASQLSISRYQAELKVLLTKEQECQLKDQQLVRLRTQLDESAEQRSKWEQEVLTLREQLKNEFENLANKILESNSQKLSASNEKQVQQIIAPLMENIGVFKKKVEDVYDKEARERISLSHQIDSLKELNSKIAEEAFRLTSVLKGDNKSQGNWGEMILEKVLEGSGLTNGREYITQASLRSEEGKQLRPDVIVLLPGERSMIVDAKVSLTAYEKYCESDDESEKQVFLGDHIQSVRNHISELSKKKYEQLPQVKTLDYVLLFFPIEASFLKAMEESPGLYQEAYDKHIVLVCPSTLMVTLRTVENIWRFEKQNINALKIADTAGKLHDQLALVVETVLEHGDQLKRAGNSYDVLVKRISEGRGNLVGRVETLRTLGAKTRKKMGLTTDGSQPEKTE